MPRGNPGYSDATPRPRYVFLWAAKPLDLVRIRDPSLAGTIEKTIRRPPSSTMIYSHVVRFRSGLCPSTKVLPRLSHIRLTTFGRLHSLWQTFSRRKWCQNLRANQWLILNNHNLSVFIMIIIITTIITMTLRGSCPFHLWGLVLRNLPEQHTKRKLLWHLVCDTTFDPVAFKKKRNSLTWNHSQSTQNWMSQSKLSPKSATFARGLAPSSKSGTKVTSWSGGPWLSPNFHLEIEGMQQSVCRLPLTPHTSWASPVVGITSTPWHLCQTMLQILSPEILVPPTTFIQSLTPV